MNKCEIVLGSAWSPRPHQSRAINDVVAGFSNPEVQAGQLIMPCGTGKTLTSLWIKEAMQEQGLIAKSSLTAVLFPSLGLLSQTLRCWKEARSTQWSFIVVCSDSKIGEPVDPSELEFEKDIVKISGTTDIQALDRFLEDTPGEKVVFATYHSSRLLGTAALKSAARFDLVICDEAHRLVGNVDRDFASVIDRDAFPAKYRLFMTATPRYLKSKYSTTLEESDTRTVGMDNTARFGMVLHALSFSQAVKEDLLCDYRVVITVAEDAATQQMVSSKKSSELAGQNQEQEDALKARCTLEAAEKFDLHRIVSFHRTISRSRSFAASFLNVAHLLTKTSSRAVQSLHVDGSMTTSERETKMAILASEKRGIALVANARCLTEGIDVPSLDAVVFGDPRESEIDVIQAVGRAIRKAPGKSVGYIILPVVCNSVNNADSVLSSEGFERVRDVLLALQAHDEALGVQSEIRPPSSPSPKQTLFGGKIIIEILSTTNELDVDLLRPRLAAEVLEAGDPNGYWMSNLTRVRNFFTSVGRWPSPHASDDVERKLGIWVSTARTQSKKFLNGEYARGMNQKRFEALNSTLGWTIDSREEQFERKIRELTEFVQARSRVPRRAASADVQEITLALWLKNLRYEVRRHARRKAMPKVYADRLQRLVDLGVISERDIRGLHETAAA